MQNEMENSFLLVIFLITVSSLASKNQKPFKLVRAIVHNVWQGRKQVFLG